MDKAAAKLLAPRVVENQKVETTPTLTRENAAILARLIDNSAASSSAETNINKKN